MIEDSLDQQRIFCVNYLIITYNPDNHLFLCELFVTPVNINILYTIKLCSETSCQSPEFDFLHVAPDDALMISS